MSDSRTEIKTAIDDFLAIVEDDHVSTEDRFARLRRSLDRLAHVQHSVSYTFDERDYPDAPRHDSKELREAVERGFPDLGYYNVPNCMTQQIAVTKINVADAINDITEIAQELYDVRWYWANTSIDNALWHFSNSYWTHWEEHLRTLQLCLHRLDKGSDEQEVQ